MNRFATFAAAPPVSLLVLALALTTGLGACGDDAAADPGLAATAGAGTPGCNDDPWSCPAGEVCWFTTDPSGGGGAGGDGSAGHRFACLVEGDGQQGDACTNYIDFATCGEGLTCSALEGSAHVCTPFCDDAHPCPDGQPCRVLESVPGALVYRACDPGLRASGSGGAGGGA